MNTSGSTTVSSETPLSTAVITHVASVTDTDPLDLTPLYDAIDPDLLDSLCDSNPGFTRLEFAYEGRTVTVDESDDGFRISVSERGPSADNSSDKGVADTGSST